MTTTQPCRTVILEEIPRGNAIRKIIDLITR